MTGKEVPQYDADSVRALFDEMAATYGPVNVISSFGFCVRWRHQAVAGMNLESAQSVVDLMSGMGELWRSLAHVLPASAQVVAIDISPAMTARAQRRQPFALDVKLGDALSMDLPAAAADAVVSSFGVKTFDVAHFRSCLEHAGLEAVQVSYFFGCATRVRGRKPLDGV